MRGVANLDLTPELVLALGPRGGSGARRVAVRGRAGHPAVGAAARGGAGRRAHRPRARRSRRSAWCRRRRWRGWRPPRARAGAVISASHNRFEDNGVKLFAPGGRKLTDDVETALEAELHALLAHEGAPAARTGDAVGTVVDGVATRSTAGPTRCCARSTGAASRGCRWWSTAPTAPPPRSRPRCCGPSAPRSRCSTTSPTAPTSTPAAGPPTRRTCRRPWSSAAPTSASPSTATPTGCWRSTPTAGSSTATRSSPSPPSTGATTAGSPRTPSSSP